MKNNILIGFLIILGIIVGGGIALVLGAIVALIVTWALNSFTQLHPTFWTTYIVLIVASLLFGGGSAASKRR